MNDSRTGPQAPAPSQFIRAMCIVLGLLAGCSEPTTPKGGTPPAVPAALATGMVHSCLLETSGAVTCWGRWGGVAGQPAGATSPTFVTPRDGSLRFASISAGSATCGLTHDGQAFCWGQNLDGEVGDGTTIPRSKPTPVVTSLRFSTIAVGAFATCALSRDGRAYCWGRADNGRLGTGVIVEGKKELRPVPVAGNASFSMLSGGLIFCALTTSGQTACWGEVGSFDPTRPLLPGNCGQVYWVAFEGTGCAAPTSVAGAPRFSSLGIGASGPTMCAVTDADAAYCWGEGWLGTLGNGQAGEGTHAVTPVAVAGRLIFRRVSAGASHVCGLTTDGKAYCWGNNFRGTLGNGASGTGQPGFGIPVSAVPVAVAGGHNFVSLTAGAAHTCGITSAGAVWCWGSGTEGQLGQPAEDSSIPVRVNLPDR